ncbi:MAG TPA: aspartate-semialdehyde dehydrogenase [Fimbriimonas sp.]
MTNGLGVAVVGATGAVGNEFLRLFDERSFPIGSLSLLASKRSVSRTLRFRGEDVPVLEATPEAFEGVDVAFFSAGASRSRELAPAALKAGALVVDNSSAYRMAPDVPLVVPEVNLDAVLPEHRLIANPNCVAAILVMAVHPLRQLGKIERLIVSTYQSASGGGAAMMQRLLEETRSSVDPSSEAPDPNMAYPPYAFNLFSHNTPINDLGYNEEEAKVVAETQKILGDPSLKVNVTCIRVPVLRAHSESVTVEFDGPAPSEEAVRQVFRDFPGVRLVDDRAANHFPTPLEASGRDEVLVGRIRKDVSNPNALCLFVVGDQLLKGAALNAVQIAEALVRR